MKIIAYKNTIIWLTLILLTLVFWILGSTEIDKKFSIPILLLSIFIKSYFIISDYMNLRYVAWHWKVLVHGWLIFLLIVLFFLYH